jgi:SHS2 domain-containing protein
VKFELLDISGDAGVRAFGRSREEAFANAAVGMYSLMTDPELLEEEKTLTVIAEGDSPEGLLVAWLNELIFRFDAQGLIGKTVSVRFLSDTEIDSKISGQDFDPERHEKRLLVKAATYHRVRIEEKNGIWEIDVVFDI